MGLGGDLLWTPALRALYTRNGRRTLLCDRPKLSDVLVGAAHDRASRRHLSPVFAGNPFVDFPPCPGKSSLSRFLDTCAEGMIGFNRLKAWVEDACHRRERARHYSILYLDLPHHSYVENIDRNRSQWKSGGHIIDILASSVGLETVIHDCDLFFTPDDEETAKRLLSPLGGTRYVTIEPSTNTDYFGELRSWPYERWQDVVNWLRATYSDMAVVQIGVESSRPLDGCVNMCGKTSFRQAALFIRHSDAFLGTEGGLMHGANAVRAKALILWGGLTEPAFAAYPDRHVVIHHGADCAPCGLLGHCPNGRRCMLSITPAEVVAALSRLLQTNAPTTPALP